MAKTTLKQQLEEAQEQLRSMANKVTNAQAERNAMASRLEAMEADNNSLRDQLMEVTLDRENMRGYLMRAAEEEPIPPIQPQVERRYASPPARDFDYQDFSMSSAYGRREEKPKRWYHR